MNAARKITVIGDGGWGTTLAILLAQKGMPVTLWGIFPDYVSRVKAERESVKFLPGVTIPAAVTLTSSLDEALSGAAHIVLATPSQYFRGVLDMLKMHDLRQASFISVTKGIERETLKRMSEVAGEVLGDARFAVMSGPTIALEVAHGAPTTVVVSSTDSAFAGEVQDLFMTERFRVYTTDDVTGVELGGSLKNIIAIAAGMSDSLGFGTNAKAALLTRGIVEITRLGLTMGARRETFYGLSGLGDLATTCMSRYSRNRWLGEEIGKGKGLQDILAGTDMVVEGVVTAQSARDLAARQKVEMPITTEIYRVLYERKDPKRAVRDLMTRSPKVENEL